MQIRNETQSPAGPYEVFSHETRGKRLRKHKAYLLSYTLGTAEPPAQMSPSPWCSLCHSEDSRLIRSVIWGSISWFESWLYLLLAVWPWASYLSSLCSNFLISKHGGNRPTL